MIELRDKNANDLIGTIDDEELQFLVDDFEEESRWRHPSRIVGVGAGGTVTSLAWSR